MHVVAHCMWRVKQRARRRRDSRNSPNALHCAGLLAQRLDLTGFLLSFITVQWLYIILIYSRDRERAAIQAFPGLLYHRIRRKECLSGVHRVKVVTTDGPKVRNNNIIVAPCGESHQIFTALFGALPLTVIILTSALSSQTSRVHYRSCLGGLRGGGGADSAIANAL